MDKSNTVKLFVGNLALDTTQEELSAIFEAYGQVVSCSVLRQFAFVHLHGDGAADRAIRELNGREFRGRNLVVEESRGRPLHSTKVFVGNLSGMCTTEDLQELFQTFGKVLECDKVKGYAFVHMENKEDALQAIEALHGTSFKGRPLSVELSKVQPSKQTPTGKIPCVSCGKQGHYAGECPAGKTSLEHVHNSVYNTSTFDPTYAALSGLTAGARADGNAVYGALASQVYGANVANQLYGTVAANQAAMSQGATQMYGQMGHNIYGQAMGNHPVYLAAAPGLEMQAAAAAVNPAYAMAPAMYGGTAPAYAHIGAMGAMGAADHTSAFLEAARQAHYFAQGQHVLHDHQAAVVAAAAAAKSGERDRSPLRRSMPLLPDPVMKPFMYQRAKPRRPLLPTPAGRAAEEAAEAAEDPMARYYAEYYQQLQQYPQFQYAYPPPAGAMTAMPVAAMAQGQPGVVPVGAMAAGPRVYEPPLPPPPPPSSAPPRKENVLRRPPPELSLHAPEPPYR
ncbi:hypothetical protein NHX12_013997 [Muraenolepis orangiensis]|uniref:RNA-binding protein 14 n=1 Tax=Muraenolepis orangiensis TaxID=630683 RepID=A0A9Q0DBG8_9TELE|nr:hypothetical protein NHX12_013997 [Muraenolepis orangiensis]